MSADRLREIHQEMNDLLEEAKNIVRQNGSSFEYDRAKAYWIGWIDNALNKNNPYDTTMLDSIKAIEHTESDSEEDEEDE